jgi:hypothetical protein
VQLLVEACLQNRPLAKREAAAAHGTRSDENHLVRGKKQHAQKVVNVTAAVKKKAEFHCF